MDERRRKRSRRHGAAACAALVFALSALLVPAGAVSAPDPGGETQLLVPVGKAIGVKLFAEGVLVVGLSENEGAVSPAKKGGMKAGDLILTMNDVTIEWKSEHAECLAALLAEENAVAMLPQPFVTTAQMKNDKIKVRLDLNAEWDAVQAGSDAPSQLITGVVAARKAFIEENPEAVAAFMESYAASVEFVNANVDEAAELIGKYEIVPAAVAKKAIPACNITFLAGGEMRQALSGYLNVLFEQNPKAVGGALPGEDFYYGGN